jgi:predicted outer membrane repeat protein
MTRKSQWLTLYGRLVTGLFLVGGLVLVPAATSGATTAVTLYVSNSGTVTTGCTGPGADACQTIAQGVTAAQLLSTDDVTIDVAASTTPYNTNVDISNVNPSLTIAGAGAATTTLDGTSSSYVIEVGYRAVVTVTGVTLENGSNANGGAVNSEGYFTATNVVFSDNDGGTYGGAIYDAEGPVTVTNSTFSGNSAGWGGAVADEATVTLTSDTFSLNTAEYGAALYSANDATVDAEDDTFVSNTASGSGGGIDSYGPLTAINDTFLNNVATNGEGGGIYTDGSGSTTDAVNDSFEGGTAVYGPGIFMFEENSFTLKNSVFDDAACSRESGSNAITDSGYNVTSDATCVDGTTSKIDDSHVNLATALAANGSTGPETLALESGSDAINDVPRANCTVVTDARGVTRLASAGQTDCDAGAVEYTAVATSAPSAPQKLTPKAGNRSITLTWIAPKSTGGSPITWYRVYCSKTKPVPTTGKVTGLVKPTLRTFKVGGLTNGVHYNCVVIATNAIGRSPVSNNAGASPKV